MKKIIFTNLLTVILALQVTVGIAATTVVQCNTSTITSQLNTCTPEVTLNIASIGTVFDSIKSSPVQSSIVSSIFDASAPIAKITNNSPYHVSFYGQTRPSILGGSSKRILVNITSWPNSSSVGISQLLSSKSVPISNYPTNAFYGYGPLTYKKLTYPNNCTTVDSSNPLTPVLSCTIASISYKPNLVISQVAPGEYEALNKPVSGSLGKLSIIRSTPTFLQGFGIAVNDNFYRALQGKNISDGVLPPSCTVGDMTGVCQPSIKQAQLASLIFKDGGVKASSDLIPGDTTALTLNQTVATHSQKAAQNLLLLNNPCGLTTNVNKLNAALTPISSVNSTNKLTVTENFQYNNDLAIAIATGAGYQIGLVPLSSNSLYIKLDESSPNFDINGQASYARRIQTANGLNPLATMTYTVRMVNEDARVKAVADAFWLALQSSSWSDLTGLSYLDGAADSGIPKQSNVQRLDNTNCSPLIHYRNKVVIYPPSQPDSLTPPTSIYFSIGGIVSGLPNGQSLTLVNNRSNESITVSANGNFAFNSRYGNGQYIITVGSMPSGYNCTVQNGTVTVSNSNVNNISVFCTDTNIFYNSLNGSYYEYVTAGGITWQQAKVAAERLTFNGMQGYLATVTTLSERNFIDEIIFSGNKPGNVYVGGSDAYQEGVWRWVTGPEGLQAGGKGLIFFDGSNRTDIPTNDLWLEGAAPSANQNTDSNDYLYMYVAYDPSFHPSNNSTGSLGEGGPSGYLVEYSASYGPMYLSGTLSGLDAGQTITLSNNDNDPIRLSANGAFNFTKPIPAGTTYSVSIQQEPNYKLCKVSQGSGTSQINLTNISVECLTPMVTTLAGSGVTGSANGTGTAASVWSQSGVAVDSSGNVYVADSYNKLIRKITPAGVVSTLAGSGVSGSANGTGTAASFAYPHGVAVDSSGNVYVADTYNHLIRKITPAGVVSTLAGSGVFGSANGTGTAASFAHPHGVAVDSSGNVYVADTGNNLIRKITPAGVVSTLAGSGELGGANGTGTAASFAYPYGVAVDSSGNVYVADNVNQLIRKITPAGVVSTLAGSRVIFNAPAIFLSPTGIAVDSSGNVYVASLGNHLIRKITPAGVVSTLAGSGVSGNAYGTGTAASFASPYGVAVDSSGSVYVLQYKDMLIRKITFVKP